MPLERVTAMAANVAKPLVDVPDFLRLGLMLALERRPTEPRGRTVFLQVRDIAHQRTADAVRELFPARPDGDVRAARAAAPRRRDPHDSLPPSA